MWDRVHLPIGGKDRERVSDDACCLEFSDMGLSTRRSLARSGYLPPVLP